MSKKSRNKGAAGEREFIRIVEHLTGGVVKLRRNLEQTRSGGDDCLGHEMFSFEIKRYSSAKDGDIAKWWQQAVTNCGGKSPALAYRIDFQRWKVMIHPAYPHFKLNDCRGCFSMDIELFCRLLLDDQALTHVQKPD